jgi:hypothetical protein
MERVHDDELRKIFPQSIAKTIESIDVKGLCFTQSQDHDGVLHASVHDVPAGLWSELIEAGFEHHIDTNTFLWSGQPA